MYNLHFLRHGNLTFTVFHFFLQFAAISYCTYNLNKNSKFYQQNLQAYIHLFLYPSLNFPFESEFFITCDMNNHHLADVNRTCG